MSNTKNYIGKGKAQQFGVRVTIQMRLAEEFIYEKNGENYLTFFVSELQRPDDYGKTHTAYVLERTPSDAEAAVADAQELQNKTAQVTEPVVPKPKTKKVAKK